MLVGVGMRAGGNPQKFMFAPLAHSVVRGNYNKGDRRNFWAGSATVISGASVANKSAIPSGYRNGGSWAMAPKAGGMSSLNEARASLSATGNLAQGINIGGSISLALVTTGSAAAVASALGSAAMSLSVSGTAVAPLNAVGSVTLSLSAAGTLSSIGHITGSATTVLTPSSTLTAIGHMVSTPINQDLTADAIASTVWSAVAAGNNASGTMGEKLNDAGSASNPWTEVIESGYTAAEILKLLASVNLGKVSGAGTGTEVFRDIGDTKARVTATVDSSGNRTAITLDAS